MYEQRLDVKDFIQTMLHVLMLLVANALTAFLIRVASLRTALVQVSINLCLLKQLSITAHPLSNTVGLAEVGYGKAVNSTHEFP